MSAVITICSGKGGVGKSTVAALLSLALSRREFKVLLVDADLGLNNLDLILRVKSEASYDLCDVATGNCALDEALVRVNSKLDLITFLSAAELQFFDEEAVFASFKNLALLYDVVILDSPAGIEKGFEFCFRLSSQTLIVTNPRDSALRDALKVRALIRRERFQSIAFVLNRFSGAEEVALLAGGRISAEEIAFRIGERRDLWRGDFGDRHLQEQILEWFEGEKAKAS